MSVLTNPSLLLLRNSEELTGKSILVVNFAQDGFLTELKKLNPQSKITAFSYNHANGEFAKNTKDGTTRYLETNRDEISAFFFCSSHPETNRDETPKNPETNPETNRDENRETNPEKP